MEKYFYLEFIFRMRKKRKNINVAYRYGHTDLNKFPFRYL